MFVCCRWMPNFYEKKKQRTLNDECGRVGSVIEHRLGAARVVARVQLGGLSDGQRLVLGLDEAGLLLEIDQFALVQPLYAEIQRRVSHGCAAERGRLAGRHLVVLWTVSDARPLYHAEKRLFFKCWHSMSRWAPNGFTFCCYLDELFRDLNSYVLPIPWVCWDTKLDLKVNLPFTTKVPLPSTFPCLLEAWQEYTPASVNVSSLKNAETEWINLRYDGGRGTEKKTPNK